MISTKNWLRVWSERKSRYFSPDVRGEGGVIVYKPKKCYAGYTLFCRNRGSMFYLIDIEGNVVHMWKPKTSIHFGELLPNGNLLYSTADRSIEERRGVHELDWKGKEVWYYRCPVDHDARRLENGNTLILCREEVINEKIHYIYPDYRAIYNPYIIEITPEKETVWEWHGDQHTEELDNLLELKFPCPWDDWAHCNTVQSLPDTPLGRKDSRFGAGNVLFSYRTLDTIGVIEKETGEIVWAWGPGIVDGQHHPMMLPNGNILLFDNGTRRGYSRILEIDPSTEGIVWNYVADPLESFFSAYVSGQQRLPNGNTLICEGGTREIFEGGRIFEVTMEGETVWEYRNPYHSSLSEGQRGLYRHSGRYSRECVEKFLEKDARERDSQRR